MSKPSAKIINAHFEEWGDATVAIGLCVAHEGRPELVGRVIHTSRVLGLVDGKVETMNTLYEVELKPDEDTARFQYQ